MHVPDCIASNKHQVAAGLEGGHVKHFGAWKLKIHLIIDLGQSALDFAAVFQFNGDFWGQALILVWEAFKERPKQLES